MTLRTSHDVYLHSLKSDFNIHVDDPTNSADARTFLDLLDSAGLKQLVQEPTHSRGHTLDLLIVRDNEEKVKNIALLASAPSDHAAITFTATLARPQSGKKTIVTRNLRDVDYTSFRESIEAIFKGASNLDEMDVNAKVDLSMSPSLPLLMGMPLLVRRRYNYDHIHAPWYNNALRSSKQKVRRSERKWRKSNPSSTVAKLEMHEAVTEYNCLEI